MFLIPEWAVGVALIIVAVSIAKAIRGRTPLSDRLMRGRRGRDLAPLAGELETKLGELEDVQRRLDEIDDLQRRLGELEERVDFAERLLAQRREERLPPSQSAQRP